ncbi:MAG: iron-containing redox enzyme family protein, partial [Patescibacteria group bacterium]
MRSHSLTSIDAAIARWALLKHPFYQAWTLGTLSRAALKRYARDYYPFVARFPRLVSALHSRVDDLGTRQLLLENLIDEERGDSPHPELWLRFAEGVGVGRADLDESPDAMAPSVKRLVGDYERLAREAPVAAALAALYAYESQIPEV